VLECALANSFEGFVADDALEGGVFAERPIFDDFELIGESDTREGVASTECSRFLIRYVAVLTECHTHEMLTVTERLPWNALKCGTAGEVDSKKGRATVELLVVIPSNRSDVGSLHVELN